MQATSFFSIALATASALAGASAASADVVSVSQGAQDTGLATASPGTAFSLDYRGLGAEAGIALPYRLVGIDVIFQTSGCTFSHLNLQLDAAPGVVYTIPGWTLSGPGRSSQTAYGFSDPGWQPEHSDWLIAPLTQGWRDELADGVLNGHLWIDDPVLIPDWFHIGASGHFLLEKPSDPVPEPSGAAILLAGGLGLLQRRRGRMLSAA